MEDPTRLNQVRKDSLERIERAERHSRLATYGAAAVEAALLGGFLLLADFANRTHVLLLIATVAVYTILALGLLAVGAHVSRNTQLVLRAIELVGGRKAD